MIITSVAGQQLEEMDSKEGQEADFEPEINVDVETESTLEMYDEGSSEQVQTRVQCQKLETVESQQVQQQGLQDIKSSIRGGLQTQARHVQRPKLIESTNCGLWIPTEQGRVCQ